MEKKINDLVIEPPDGMEAYLEGNIVKFKPIEKKLAYKDIAKELFENKSTWFADTKGNVDAFIPNNHSSLFFNNSTSVKQVQKLLAINQLMNVAKHLNGNWQPDWNNNKESKYYIFIYNGKIDISNTALSNCLEVYFKSKEFAQQAIDILGEETIKLALCTDW